MMDRPLVYIFFLFIIANLQNVIQEVSKVI